MRQAIALLLAITGCGGNASRTAGLQPGEGYIPVRGGKVWYRIVGSGARTPLLVLHGGPGVPSAYLKPLAALADERRVVFYEQLGSGKSDQPSDTTLWTSERCLEELGQVRAALGLEQVHLYGHSWGTILATEHVLGGARGVRNLILGGPALDAQRYLHDNDSLIGTLPDSVAKVLRSDEGRRATPSARYRAANLVYLEHFFARRQPWSIDLRDSSVERNNPVPSRVIVARLGTYNRTNRLGELRVPTLLLVGRYDTSTPGTVETYRQRIPGAQMVVFDSSGHVPMQDQPERYVQVIRDFLHRVER